MREREASIIVCEGWEGAKQQAMREAGREGGRTGTFMDMCE